jgi:hypothetical protein
MGAANLKDQRKASTIGSPANVNRAIQMIELMAISN